VNAATGTKRSFSPRTSCPRSKNSADTIGIIQSGKLLSEGTLAQLRDQHHEQDLEDIFVKVVAPHYAFCGGQLTCPRAISASSIARELTEALRDRRTLITMFVLPIIIFPLLSVGFGASYRRANWKGERRKFLRLWSSAAMIHSCSRRIEKSTEDSDRFRWKVIGRRKLSNKQVPVVVEIPEGFERNLADQKEQIILIHDYEGDLKSETAKGKVRNSSMSIATPSSKTASRQKSPG